MGRSATDDELWEHDAGLAALVADLAGRPDDDAVAGISQLEGCAELATWLAGVDVERLGEFDVVEVVAAFERVASWARSRAAHVAARLSRRAVMNPYWPPHAGSVGEPCGASTELSLRLGTSKQSAGRLVATGRALEAHLHETGAALESGSIDWFKAQAITECLDGIPWQVALEVEARVLPGAPRRTHRQLRRDLARALADVDPQDAQERHARAVERRCVERPRVLPDGMASVRAVIPAEAAARLDATLQAAAVAARADGDARTVDQLRADALDAMAGAAWSTGWIGDRGQGAVRVGHSSGPRAQVLVTVGIGTLLGLDERPGELAGYGPIGADVARSIVAEGTWRRLLVDPVSGAPVHVGRARYRPPDGMAELVRARNPTCVIPSCSVAASRCDLDHTVPFTHDAPPGDTTDGAGHPSGRTGGTTAGNLGPLCRNHHLLKTHGGFRLEQPRDGTFIVTTPTGHRYVEEPGPLPGVPQERPVAEGHGPERTEVVSGRSAVPQPEPSETGCEALPIPASLEAEVSDAEALDREVPEADLPDHEAPVPEASGDAALGSEGAARDIPF